MTRDPESVYRSTPKSELPLFEDSEGLLTAHTGSQASCGVDATPGKPSDVAHARRSDPQTSHEAAKSVVNLGRTRDAIVSLLREYGRQTDEQIADMGLVEACGEGRTASGRKCTVWRLKEAK